MTGERLMARRVALGMTRREMAAYLGVSARMVHYWETGTRGMARQAFAVGVALNAAENARGRGLPLPNWKELAS